MAENKIPDGALVLVNIRVTVDTMPSTDVPDLQTAIYTVLGSYEGVSVEVTMREPRLERRPAR